MSRKFQIKSGLAVSENPNKNFLQAGIFKITPTNTLDKTSFGKFLLNPSTWEEHKASNWVQHSVPGQSDPIIQWISGGARMINFEALVTKDTTQFNLQDPPDFLSNLATSAVNAVGNIASAFLGINVPNIGDLLPVGDQGEGEDLSIKSYLDYYRSLMYPITKEQTKLLASPPLVVLFVGKTFGEIAETISFDTEVWVVTDLKIKITKQLPNLAPMEALVSFQLIEYTKQIKDQATFGQKVATGITDSVPNLSSGNILNTFTA